MYNMRQNIYDTLLLLPINAIINKYILSKMSRSYSFWIWVTVESNECTHLLIGKLILLCGLYSAIESENCPIA